MLGHRSQRGQILPIVALVLVVALGIAAFSIDIGYAYYAKRQLQAAVDAAALAGAQDLPDAAAATTIAQAYAAANSPSRLAAFSFTYATACTQTAVVATGCSPSVNPNQLTVRGTATTSTWFARIFGVDSFSVKTHANACSPCSSTPVDIVVAIDRTGSMCDSTNSSGCIDLNNAKAGVRTMLGNLNPPYAQVGMIAFPPLQTTSTSACSAPYNSLGNSGFDAYDSPSRGYLTDPIGGDYKVGTVLNTASGLYLHTAPGGATSCIQAGGSTSYSEALRQAKNELDAHGRPEAPDYIVFLTDGEANMGSVYGASDAQYPPGNSDDQQPCHTAIDLAGTYKSQGVTIYSIGYALGNKYCTAGGFGPNIPAVRDGSGHIITPAKPCTPFTSGCYHKQSFNGTESPAITSSNTVSQIASPGNFYNQPSAGQLNTIFAAIATDIGKGASRLVDDGF
jgi:Flp pilus assembly protein TadG